MNINTVLLHLFPNADKETAWEITRREGTEEITAWNLPDPQPTQAELQAAWPAAEAAQNQKRQDRETQRQDLDTRARQALGFTPKEYDVWRDSL